MWLSSAAWGSEGEHGWYVTRLVCGLKYAGGRDNDAVVISLRFCTAWLCFYLFGEVSGGDTDWEIQCNIMALCSASKKHCENMYLSIH